MAGLLRKILPIVQSIPKHDDDSDANNTEYSIAIAYSGPPISYNIPRALPIAVDQIPIAAIVSSPLLNDNSLPVNQPIVKRTAVERKRPQEPELSSEPTFCNSSLTNSGVFSNGLVVSCKSPTLVDSSNEIGCATGYDCQPKSFNGIQKCGKFENPDSIDNSSEILDSTIDDKCMSKLSDRKSSGKLTNSDFQDNSCVILKLSDGNKKDADVGFQNGTNPANWESTESSLSSNVHLSKVFSCKNECCNNEKTPHNVEGLSIVTSSDSKISDIVPDESYHSEAESIDVRPKDERQSKKVLCCKCLKGYPSTEMEVCIVCDARHCGTCVLKSMGSTPEGRKCVVCIDFKVDECITLPSDGEGSSGKLKTSGCHDNLYATIELPDDTNEGANAGFQDYMYPESTESGLSSHGHSSRVFSCKEEDCSKEETPCHVKRPSVLTFHDPKTNDVVHEESGYSEVYSICEKPRAERQGKKGSCYRCLKGNWFTEKELCIVCGAKYCCKCVLRAMGSMPEGRKCVTCIGFRVDDGKRGSLGKSSRMLKRLLTGMEVKQIMRSEISCKANQLPPERVFVNNEPLSQKELVILQSCPNPPKKLNPGYYWYDKVSGFWGKTGQRPCQIISPRLNVGGQMMQNASNGNTNVFINIREITKRELWMLKFAGVQCEGCPYFWVSDDGAYQEEGSKIVKGYIWDKTRIKIVCALLSLPTPPQSGNPGGDLLPGVNYCEQKILCKLLLLGGKKGGTSTIYKQAKLLFKIPFSDDERQNIKFMIQSNLYHYIGILLEGRERFEEESLTDIKKRHIEHPGPSGQIDDKMTYAIGPRLKAFSDWLLKVMATGNLEAIFPAATREYAPFIEVLWKDAAFQATYNRRNELDRLPRVATYFLERAVEISRTSYEPSDMDILYAEGITSTNGLSCMEFSFPESPREISIDSSCQNDTLLSYQLIRVHPSSLGENCKRLEMFEDIDMVLFCVSLTDYDEFFEDCNGALSNKMLSSKQLFEQIVTHPTFSQKNFLLLLNKYDILEEKIEQVPLTRCEWFRDFNLVISHNHRIVSRRNTTTSLAQYAFHYIALKFKRLFDSLSDRKLFVSQVTALRPETVDEALKYAREILKWDEEEPNYTNIESYTNYEASLSF